VKETQENRLVLEVEGLGDRNIRGDVARSIVESGWDLNELRSAAVSLEEVFLQLTNSDAVQASNPTAAPDLEPASVKAQG
jgi:ABC-2 type transport system ATP-binding protein